MRCLLMEISMAMKLGGGKTTVINSIVFEDNNGALTTANSVNITPLAKHIGVKYYFFKNHTEVPPSSISFQNVDWLLQCQLTFHTYICYLKTTRIL